MDRYFHYYATYLAARWAGMESDKAQQLAYCCQTMDELGAGLSMVLPWHYQGESQGENQREKFSPCITGVNAKAGDGVEDELSTVNSYLDNIWLYPQDEQKIHQEESGFGTLNAELAFRCFPALSIQTVAVNHAGEVNSVVSSVGSSSVSGAVANAVANAADNTTDSAVTDEIKPKFEAQHYRHKKGFTTNASGSRINDNWRQQQNPLAKLAASQPLDSCITSQHYNPLTDIDWQRGGNFKQSFSQKLAGKHQASLRGEQTRYQASDYIAEHSACGGKTIQSKKSSQLAGHEGIDEAGIEETDVDVIDIDKVFFNGSSQQAVHSNSNSNCNSNYEPLLACVANSDFSREMLNDIIYKSRYRSEVKDMELQLLGCRLFVYQQTWRHNLKNGDKAKQLKDAFYWTLYAIECFLRATPLKNKRHWFAKLSSEHTASIDEHLSQLFDFTGEPFEQEIHWLTHLPRLLACQQQGLPLVADNWQQGLRYRKNHLLEQAMLAAKTAQSRQIKSLTGFKQSDFFKLNKAAEYHANWLACQLKHQQVFDFDTSQSLGDAAIWRL
ncbi:DUF6765 family protein [Colwellia psychrerythraea]|uniref:Uncharacterized protein n=1 Tax=Colwellia psychrerythraea TaxID=28229 RepID=A0A099KE95_COLPS|nr:DUF6765 family protein [Colwellia psychrerythraea]KGJ87938.1 hypothetical protein GAB14E_4271 [Colwellia psychrerythraea]